MFKWKKELHVNLNQKLEKIKLSEEGMLKAEINQKLDSCTKQPNSECKGKVLEDIVSSTPVNTQMTRK